MSNKTLLDAIVNSHSYAIKALEADRDRYKALAGELAEALRPFAAFACDSPHTNEPECQNCIARATLAKYEQEVRA